jgi:hypothetical protein
MACEHCKGWGVDFKGQKTEKPNLINKPHEKNAKTNPVQCKVCKGKEQKDK